MGTKNCLVCNNTFTNHLFEDRKFVSSDLEIIKKKTYFFFCNLCGNLQKEINSKYIKKIKSIYNNYIGFKKYNNGDQKKVFDIEASKNRCEVIFNLIQKKINNKIKFLDFGCSNGAMLYPMIGQKKIQLYGTDIKNILDKKIIKSKNFKGFLNLNRILSYKKKFDIITLIHVFEHFINPFDELIKIKKLLKKNGRIYIQIPNYNENFYDLKIYDHATHWNKLSLNQIFQRAGYKIEKIYTSVIDCEFTIVIRKKNITKININKKKILKEKKNILNKLLKIKEVYKKLNKTKKFSILGSSVAASLIISEFKNKIKLIYDQDLDKIGNYHYNFLIHRINKNIPEKIFLPFPKKRLRKIKKNLNKYNLIFLN
jgi:2-polyprenyl-3-methyl-5-hydroxy-6-metoxy-1,4-benzoquinol methylase